MTKILIYNSEATSRQVIIEPFAEPFLVPPKATMTIVASDDHQEVEVNLAEGGLVVWVHGKKSVTVTASD